MKMKAPDERASEKKAIGSMPKVKCAAWRRLLADCKNALEFIFRQGDLSGGEAPREARAGTKTV